MPPEQIITEAVDRVCPERKEQECTWCEGLGFRTESIEQENGLGEIQQVPCGVCKETGRVESKIIGSPITLAMILRTLLAKNPANRTKVVVESSGQFLDNVTHQLGPTWDLTHDTLSAQSPQCKQFLADLLGNK